MMSSEQARQGSSAAIPLQGQQEIRGLFAYLSAPVRAPFYQAIIRVFLAEAQRFNSYLPVEEIATALCSLDPTYTVEECRGDLDRLIGWGNVVQTLDTDRRHASIRSYLQPTVLYRATRMALDIEEFLVRAEMAAAEQAGALRNRDLLALLDLFRTVDQLVRDDLDETQGQTLVDIWRRLAELADRITGDAYRYLATLAVARREAAAADLTAYLRYKDAVVQYIQGFAAHLEEIGIQIQALFEAWERDRLLDRLVAMVARYGPAPLLAQPTPEERESAARAQVVVVTQWFRGRDHIDSFTRSALVEMQWVIERARVLLETNAVQAGYLPALHDLATHLLALEDREAAATLVAVALASSTPRLLPAHLTAVDHEPADPWRDTPAAPQVLAPIRRGAAVTVRDTPSVRRWEGLGQIQTEEDAARRDRLERLDRLFGEGERVVTEVLLRDGADADLLLRAVASCLQTPDWCWRAEDGSLIALLNPDEAGLALISSPVGAYVLAPYRLRRTMPAGVSRGEGMPRVVAREGGLSLGA